MLKSTIVLFNTFKISSNYSELFGNGFPGLSNFSIIIIVIGLFFSEQKNGLTHRTEAENDFG